jgi:hypothetical protein
MKLVTSFSLLLAAVLAPTATSTRIIRAQVMLARNLGHALRLCFRHQRATVAGLTPDTRSWVIVTSTGLTTCQKKP